MEIWTQAPGYPDYEISSLGNVRRITAAPGAKVGKVLKPGMGTSGYKFVILRRQGGSFNEAVHRLVCKAFHGGAPSGKLHVAHNDGDRGNNAESNLRWATVSENRADCVRHGTDNKGIKHPNATLGEDDVRAIRSSDELLRVLSDRYGVSESQISLIRRRKAWSHVE